MLPACGERVGSLLQQTSRFVMTGEFPAYAERAGDGMFSGVVTVANPGVGISGVTSPEADVFVVREGEVVVTPLPKDMIARPFDLPSGKSEDFTARGSIASCAGEGPLPTGSYELIVVVVVYSEDRTETVAVGGPWPLQIT